MPIHNNVLIITADLTIITGQMLWMELQKQMLFVGSPLITSLNEMRETNVYMADIPLFDVTREIVLLYEQRNAEIDITYVYRMFVSRTLQ